jgi:hypothetical protein
MSILLLLLLLQQQGHDVPHHSHHQASAALTRSCNPLLLLPLLCRMRRVTMYLTTAVCHQLMSMLLMLMLPLLLQLQGRNVPRHGHHQASATLTSLVPH